MKHVTAWLGAVAALGFAGSALAADGPMAPINAFMAGFAHNDVNAARAAHDTGDITIMDEMPPHVWRGDHAFDGWLASLTAYDKAHGRAGGVVTLAKPRVMTMDGDRAYVVAPAVYTFTQKGKPMREPATMTFALHKGASGWKIAGWSWNGTVPQPAGAKK